MSEMSISRREVLRGVSAATALSYSRILGANERLHLGVIGPGNRGRSDMSHFQKDSTVEVVALCDIWGEVLKKALEKAPNAQTFSDHRKLLEVKDLDIVLVATPDHWHVPITIDALSAGKDVYCEKPLSLTIEGSSRARASPPSRPR